MGDPRYDPAIRISAGRIGVVPDLRSLASAVPVAITQAFAAQCRVA